MKKNIRTLVFVLAFSAILAVVPLILPTGVSMNILTSSKEGTELLVNPTLANNCSDWHFGAWRFLDSTWVSECNWTFGDGKVSMEMAAEDQSFYCTMIEQPYHNQPIYDLQNEYVVTWRGSMNSGKAQTVGALGMGVNFFLDAIKDGEAVETLELYIFFFQDGFYTIPVESFKDYGYRGSYWFEELVQEPSEETWRYFYYHPIQLEFGKTREITFSLNRCLEVVRLNAGSVYEGADSFRLTRVMSVMELIYAEGSFTTEYVSLKEVN